MTINEVFFAKGSNLTNLICREYNTKSIEIVEEQTKKGIPFVLHYSGMSFASDPLGLLKFKNQKYNFKNGHLEIDIDLKPSKIYRLIQQFC